MGGIGKVALSYANVMFYALNNAAVDENSSEVLFKIGVPMNIDMRIFRGSLYELGTQVGLSNSSTTKAMGILYAMDAVVKLINGGPGTKTIVAINYNPTKEQFEEFLENNQIQSRKFAPTAQESILDELARLRTRVTELEKFQTHLTKELGINGE